MKEELDEKKKTLEIMILENDRLNC